MTVEKDSAPMDVDPQHKDAKLMKWIMRQVAHELRDDPAFTDPVYERMAAKIIGHAFSLFVRWLGITVLIAAGGGMLILLGALGRFPQWFGA
jgi:hypothetical protein